MSFTRKNVFGLLGLAIAMVFATSAQGAVLSMVPFNAPTDGVQISVEVSTDGANAYFTIENNSTGSAAGSSIARIYFESGLASIGLSGGTITAQAGTDFDTSFPGPGDPPSGNNMPSNSWAGNLISWGAGSPPPVNGINVGDSLTISFVYTGSESSLVDALTDATGNARMAAHILDCTNGNSCVGSATRPVPLPAALPLMLAALGGLGLMRRKSA